MLSSLTSAFPGSGSPGPPEYAAPGHPQTIASQGSRDRGNKTTPLSPNDSAEALARDLEAFQASRALRAARDPHKNDGETETDEWMWDAFSAREEEVLGGRQATALARAKEEAAIARLRLSALAFAPRSFQGSSLPASALETELRERLAFQTQELLIQKRKNHFQAHMIRFLVRRIENMADTGDGRETWANGERGGGEAAMGRGESPRERRRESKRGSKLRESKHRVRPEDSQVPVQALAQAPAQALAQGSAQGLAQSSAQARPPARQRGPPESEGFGPQVVRADKDKVKRGRGSEQTAVPSSMKESVRSKAAVKAPAPRRDPAIRHVKGPPMAEEQVDGKVGESPAPGTSQSTLQAQVPDQKGGSEEEKRVKGLEEEKRLKRLEEDKRVKRLEEEKRVKRLEEEKRVKALVEEKRAKGLEGRQERMSLAPTPTPPDASTPEAGSRNAGSEGDPAESETKEGPEHVDKTKTSSEKDPPESPSKSPTKNVPEPSIYDELYRQIEGSKLPAGTMSGALKHQPSQTFDISVVGQPPEEESSTGKSLEVRSPQVKSPEAAIPKDASPEDFPKELRKTSKYASKAILSTALPEAFKIVSSSLAPKTSLSQPSFRKPPLIQTPNVTLTPKPALSTALTPAPTAGLTPAMNPALTPMSLAETPATPHRPRNLLRSTPSPSPSASPSPSPSASPSASASASQKASAFSASSGSSSSSGSLFRIGSQQPRYSSSRPSPSGAPLQAPPPFPSQHEARPKTQAETQPEPLEATTSSPILIAPSAPVSVPRPSLPPVPKKGAPSPPPSESAAALSPAANSQPAGSASASVSASAPSSPKTTQSPTGPQSPVGPLVMAGLAPPSRSRFESDSNSSVLSTLAESTRSIFGGVLSPATPSGLNVAKTPTRLLSITKNPNRSSSVVRSREELATLLR